MTSHQSYNEQGLLSPKKEHNKIDREILMAEDSPTGIMAFPGMAPAGKPVLSRPDAGAIKDLPLGKEEETVEQELQRRIVSVAKYWTQAEQELVAGQQEFVIPRSENPYESFEVNEGHVRHMVLKWDLFSEPSSPEILPPCAPSPGPNVQKMVYFFDYFAQRLMEDQEMEPFVVYKTVNKKIAKLVNNLEARIHFSPLSVAFASPVVCRHVSEKIKPLVEFWDAMSATGKTGHSLGLESSSMHKNRRVVVMANLMKKKLDHPETSLVQKEVMPREHNHIGPLVFQMVSLLEAMNQEVKTGSNLVNVEGGHRVAGVASLPLVC